METNEEKISANNDHDKVANPPKLQPYPLSLRDAIRSTILNSELPLKEIAARMKISRQFLSRAADLNQKEFRFAASRLVDLMKATGNFEILRYLAIQTDHVIFKLPNRKEMLESGQMLGIFLAAHAQIGSSFARLNDYLTQDEKQRIRVAKALYMQLTVMLETLSILRAHFSNEVFSGKEEATGRQGSQEVQMERRRRISKQ